jgi:hypothetical protein
MDKVRQLNSNAFHTTNSAAQVKLNYEQDKVDDKLLFLIFPALNQFKINKDISNIFLTVESASQEKMGCGTVSHASMNTMSQSKRASSMNPFLG